MKLNKYRVVIGFCFLLVCVFELLVLLGMGDTQVDEEVYMLP